MQEDNANIDFNGLILGFSSTALLYLGHDPADGEKGSRQINLPLAKHNIAIIELLKSKTEGNLSPQEDELVCQVLTDLRLKFVEATKAHS